MKPAPFRYFAPSTLAEALALTAEHGATAKLLAGGQSLIPAMNFRLAQPALLIDLNRVAELAQLQAAADGGVAAGAMVRQRTLERSALVARQAPLLAAALPHIAHVQIRNRGTLGGSLAHADPAAELPAVAVALDATLELQSAYSTRTVAAADFYLGLFATELAEDEILTQVRLPALPPATGCGFAEFARRRGDYALAGACALLELDSAGRCRTARLVFFSVGETPVLAPSAAAALLGATPTPALLAEAARAAAQLDIDPLGDIHAGAAYRRHLAQVLARRALGDALAAAQSALHAAHATPALAAQPTTASS